MRKAKVKATGEIIEVKEWRGASDVVYSTPDMNMFYASNELDFLPEESPESATIEGWVAVDTSYGGLPCLHTAKPHLEKLVYDDYGCYDMVWECEGDKYMLDLQLFPDMTPKSEPKKFRITITPIEDE